MTLGATNPGKLAMRLFGSWFGAALGLSASMSRVRVKSRAVLIHWLAMGNSGTRRSVWERLTIVLARTVHLRNICR